MPRHCKKPRGVALPIATKQTQIIRFVGFYATTIAGPKGLWQASRYLSLHSLHPPFLCSLPIFKCSKGTWIFSLSSFLPKFLGFLLYSPLVLANALLNVVPLPIYCLVRSNVIKLIVRGKVKLLMCSIDSIPFRNQYLHRFSCPGALSSAFASYSSGSPDQAAGIRKCWTNPLSRQSALGILGPSPAASCQPDAKRARFEPIY